MRRPLMLMATLGVVSAVGVPAAIPVEAKVTPPTASGHAVKTSPYVALGDSYSAAAGVNPLDPSAPLTCSRSLLDYPHDIAARTDPRSFTDVSCSGARTSDFFTSQAAGVAPQLDAVTKRTRLVTMTIGGNDESVFSDSFIGCVKVSLASGSVTGDPCEQKYGSTFTDEIENQTYPNLLRVLMAVRKKAPRATVAILGYPRILPDRGELSCYPVMPISMGDVPYLDNVEDVLNGVIRQAAMKTGARFIDMAGSSVGHDACEPIGQRWIEPAVAPVNAYPVHPNAMGEAAMATQTLDQLGH